MNWHRDNLILTSDQPDEAAESTYALLQTTYWSHKRPRDTVEKILKNSLCFYLLEGSDHVGFARVISDRVTTSWLCDVIIKDEFQNHGVGSWMMQCILSHPDLNATQFVLQTATAHTFYQRLGFSRQNALMSTSVDYL